MIDCSQINNSSQENQINSINQINKDKTSDINSPHFINYSIEIND
jgi:hypothetical protein